MRAADLATGSFHALDWMSDQATMSSSKKSQVMLAFHKQSSLLGHRSQLACMLGPPLAYLWHSLFLSFQRLTYTITLPA